MPSSKPKSVTIELTPKQQERLRKVTGQACSEILVEVAKGRVARKPLSAKAAPAMKPIPGIPPGEGPGNLGGLPIA